MTPRSPHGLRENNVEWAGTVGTRAGRALLFKEPLDSFVPIPLMETPIDEVGGVTEFSDKRKKRKGRMMQIKQS